MNWFENRPVPKDKNSPLIEDICEHCEADFSKAYTMMCEVDSFGLVCSHVVCKPCLEKAEEEDGQQEVFCRDCGQKKLKKDTFEWKWWDFYAPQGDEALIICNDCYGKPTHQKRVARDLRDRQEADDYYREKYGEDSDSL